MTAATNDHKLSALKTTEILSQFWRPEVQNQYESAEVNVSQGCIPSGGSRGDSVPLFQLLLDASIP